MIHMYEYVVEVKKTLGQICLMGIILCALAYLSGDSWRIPGLILGNVTSMIYFMLLCYRVNKSSLMPVSKAISYMRIGWLLRLSFIALMLVLSIKIPLFDFVSAVIGLFSLQVVMISSASFLVIRSIFGDSR